MKLYRYILENEKPVIEPYLHKWAEWFETTDRVVEKTMVGDWEVSTVFLGLDHNFGSGGKPVLWETMVYGGPMDDYQERYSSLAKARSGHNKVVEKLRKLEPAPPILPDVWMSKHYYSTKHKRLLRPVKI